MVIRYGFLWSNEADNGFEESRKDRPCAIIVAAKQNEDGEITTILAPITHSPPNDQSTCMELPENIAKSLGLDDQKNWLRYDELNQFVWPGFDLRQIPNQKDQYVYGHLPKPLFNKIREAILKRAAKKGRARLINRD